MGFLSWVRSRPAGNKWPAIPPEVFNLRALKWLDVSDNMLLKILPDEIGRLTALSQLLATKCQLNEISSEIGRLSQLRILALGGGTVDRLPFDLDRLLALEFLELTSLGLTELPAGIGNCGFLKEINVRSNLLTALPATIGNLGAPLLVKLDASFNRLTALPPRSAISAV